MGGAFGVEEVSVEAHDDKLAEALYELSLKAVVM